MSAMSLEVMAGQVDPAVIQLLDHRYGDGLVYLRRDSAEQGAFQQARRLGLVNAEGYLTPAGRSVLARLGID